MTRDVECSLSIKRYDIVSFIANKMRPQILAFPIMKYCGSKSYITVTVL